LEEREARRYYFIGYSEWPYDNASPMVSRGADPVIVPM
jgi:hypothetical protein